MPGDRPERIKTAHRKGTAEKREWSPLTDADRERSARPERPKTFEGKKPGRFEGKKPEGKPRSDKGTEGKKPYTKPGKSKPPRRP